MKCNVSSSAFPYVESKHLAAKGEKPEHRSLMLNLSIGRQGAEQERSRKGRVYDFRQV